MGAGGRNVTLSVPPLSGCVSKLPRVLASSGSSR